MTGSLRPSSTSSVTTEYWPVSGLAKAAGREMGRRNKGSQSGPGFGRFFGQNDLLRLFGVGGKVLVELAGVFSSASPCGEC